MIKEQEEPDYKAIRAELIAKHNLTLKAVFVPQSKSRNSGEEHCSLNWKVTLLVNAHEVVTTDYMQGIGHAPSHKNPPRFDNGNVDPYLQHQAERIESETGYKARKLYSESMGIGKEKIPAPSVEEVLWCMLTDSDVIDHPTFESWASDFGMDTDSRKGEKIYRDCLEIALKLRAGLGEKLMSELRDAYQDY